MADIIGSRAKDQSSLMVDFKKIVTLINKKNKSKILSPMTITLGDEFQGVITDLPSCVEIIISFEEHLISRGDDFKLRYVVYYGKIDTKINNLNAYEMLGDGLTRARELLAYMKIKLRNKRFHIQTKNNTISEHLNGAFNIYQSIVDNWKQRDYQLVTEFLKKYDYKNIAEKMGKVPSLIWKREKSLNIEQYNSIKEIIKHISRYDR